MMQFIITKELDFFMHYILDAKIQRKTIFLRSCSKSECLAFHSMVQSPVMAKESNVFGCKAFHTTQELLIFISRSWRGVKNPFTYCSTYRVMKKLTDFILIEQCLPPYTLTLAYFVEALLSLMN